ncbi:MAG: hypothetical protein NC349_06755 [Paenibacillus sp.]|nr:hypothetical protein [Paenibacillus sp.]
MNKSTLIAALMAPALLFATSSCLSSDNNNKQEQTLNYGGSQCFNMVTDSESGESFISSDPNYTIVLDLINYKGSVSMTGLKLGPNGSSLSFKLPDMPLTFSSTEASYSLKSSLITPEGVTDQYVFNNFNLRVVERTLKLPTGYVFAPIFDVNFTINGRYKFTAFPTAYFLLGDVLAQPTGDDASAKDYKSEDSVVAISLTADKTDASKYTAALWVYDARFSENMSNMTFYAENLPVEINPYGFNITTEDGQAIKVKDSAGEIKDCSISNIHIRTSVPSGVTTVEFDADFKALQPTKPILPCHVSANLTYYYKNENN